MESKQQFDLVAIGDIVVDAFIRLKEAHVNCKLNHENCEICMAFGDKIPYESVTVLPAVGNSPNVAVACSRLGLKTALVANLGDDQHGRDCLASLKKDGVNTDYVKAQAGTKTNYHYVLWYDDDRTILIKHEEYSYALPDIGEPKWLYLSSLSEQSLDFHFEISRYLENHPGVKLAFQPGTFQIRFGHEKLTDLYRRSEILFCNREEAMKILKTDNDDIELLSQQLANLGPKIVVITDGENGAYAFQGKKVWQVPVYPDPVPPLERTGAGDAFSGAVMAALHRGLSLPEALAWGPVNATAVIQRIGSQAGLLNQEQLKEYLAKAPSEYEARELATVTAKN